MLPLYYLIKKQNKATNGKIALNLIIFTLILISAFIYLLQTNNLVSQTYKIREYQKELKNLEENHKKLQIEVAQFQSLPKLQEIAGGLNLILVEEVSYLEVPQETVVTNQILKQP